MFSSSYSLVLEVHKVLDLGQSLSTTLRKHYSVAGINVDISAEDTQLCLSMKPEQKEQSVTLQACLKDINSWMTSNFLLLNSDKTEVNVLVAKFLSDRLDHIITLDDICSVSNLSLSNL